MSITISNHNVEGQRARAKVYESELSFISECVLRSPNSETGGDFFGFWSKDGEPVILYALGPGRKATRTGTSFFQDIGYLREYGTLLNERFALEHIGAWHSHHNLGLYGPSSGDVRTMRNALSQSHPSRFLICICNIENGNSVSIGSFLFIKDCPGDYLNCEVHILPGASPIREHMQSQLEPVIGKPKSGHRNDGAAYHLRSVDNPTSPQFNQDRIEKPQFSQNSYWAKAEGQRFLKTVFDKLRNKRELAEVEVTQLTDGRIAISFEHSNTEYKLCFPDEFPAKDPYAVVSSRSRSKFSGIFQKSPQIHAVQKILNSLELLESNRSIVILKPQ